MARNTFGSSVSQTMLPCNFQSVQLDWRLSFCDASLFVSLSLRVVCARSSNDAAFSFTVDASRLGLEIAKWLHYSSTE